MIEESVLRTTDDHKVAFRRWLHGIIILDVWWGVVMLDHMSQISNLDIVCEPSSVGESLSVYHGMGVLRIIIEFKSMSLLSCGSSSCNGLVWNKNRELTYEVTSETMSVSHYIYIYIVCVCIVCGLMIFCLVVCAKNQGSLVHQHYSDCHGATAIEDPNFFTKLGGYENYIPN